MCKSDSSARIATVVRAQTHPGEGERGEDPGVAELISCPPCLWLAGTAPSISFQVCTWGRQYQLRTQGFLLMNISASALMHGSFAGCPLDPRWPEASGPGCAGWTCFWCKDKTDLLRHLPGAMLFWRPSLSGGVRREQEGLRGMVPAWTVSGCTGWWYCWGGHWPGHWVDLAGPLRGGIVQGSRSGLGATLLVGFWLLHFLALISLGFSEL